MLLKKTYRFTVIKQINQIESLRLDDLERN